ncbi:MAG: hypothetical protein V3T64_03460 [Myxococcota bacterium]
MRIRRPTQSRPRGLQIGCSAALTGLTIGLIGCASAAAPDTKAAADPSWRAERIEALRRAIAEDHASLEDLIAQPRQPEPAPQLHRDPELRAIAERLSDHQRELARLEALARSMTQSMTQKAVR